jgi:hypothetical protein
MSGIDEIQGYDQASDPVPEELCHSIIEENKARVYILYI